MYTTVARVRALLASAGISASDEEIQQAIDDAVLVVQQHDFFIRGRCSESHADLIVDEGARFSGRVQVDALVIRGEEKTTVAAVVSNTVVRTADPLNFKEGDRYRIEDLQRYELAERYKAAALIYDKSVQSGSVAAAGSSERLGPIAVTSGTWDSQWSRVTAASNTFEEEFLKIVGLTFAAV